MENNMFEYPKKFDKYMEINTIAIVTAMQYREGITEIFVKNVVEIINASKCVIVFSCSIPKGDKSFDIIKNKIPNAYIQETSESDTLGIKFNASFAPMKDICPDYYFHTGCDDIYSPQVINKYLSKNPKKNSVFGFTDMYVYDYEKGSYYYFGGYEKERKGITIGAGRLIGSEIIEAANWDIWEKTRTQTMDGKMSLFCKDKGFKITGFTQNELGANVIDLKSKHNITSIDKMMGFMEICEKPIL